MRRKCLLSLWEPWERLPGERCRLLRTFPPVKSPITRFGDFIIVSKAPGRVGAQIIARDTGHWSHQGSLRLVGVGGPRWVHRDGPVWREGPRSQSKGRGSKAKVTQPKPKRGKIVPGSFQGET